MRSPWSWRRRRKAAVAAAETTAHRPGSWADVALPPAEGPAVTIRSRSPRLQLAFRDGTRVDVAPNGEEGAALWAAADQLLDASGHSNGVVVQEPSRSADN
jgi:hypothetical protein